jgi:hypothetical protein
MASFSPFTSPSDAETLQEFKVKAGYLFNIPMFADWAPSSEVCSSFTIAVMGATPLHEVLKTTSGKRIKALPVDIRTVQEIPEIGCCKVLFIASSERHRLQQLLPNAHKRGIMTISDMRDFVKLGGMVSLVMVGNKISYDLNLAAARSAKISFSSQLMNLANDIRN